MNPAKEMSHDELTRAELHVVQSDSLRARNSEYALTQEGFVDMR